MKAVRFDRNGVFASLTLVAGVFAGTAHAQSPSAPPSGDGWEFTVAPYVMGASLDGTTTVMGRDADVDVTAGDIFDHMKFGAMGMAAARKGNWGVVADAVWVNLEIDSPMPPATFKPTIALISAAAVRRLNDNVDVTLGARWNHVNAQVDLLAPVPMSVEKSHDWVDPTVGVVLRTPGKGRFHGTLIADVGGFGLGSDLSWQVFPTAGVQLSKGVSLEAGWRFLSVDYETGEGRDHFKYDMLYTGPVVGFTFKF